MASVTIVDHPLVGHHLAQLRSVETQPPEFRLLVRRLAVLLAYEATKDLAVAIDEIQTPLTKTTGQRLRQRIGLVPILRAGLGMVDPVLDLIPDAEALQICFDLIQDEGLVLGGSSGINIAGAIRLAREMGPGHTIVTILADYGTRYQSKMYNPVFLREKGLPVPEWMDVE